VRPSTDEEIADGWQWRPLRLIVWFEDRLWDVILPLPCSGQVLLFPEVRWPLSRHVASEIVGWANNERDRRMALLGMPSPSTAIN
jgi:hypothetical protein